jgi:hypothetical protein
LSLLEPVYERGKIYRETILDRWMK